MKAKKVLIATLLITFILFVFGIVGQFLPWGVPTAQVISSNPEVESAFVSNTILQKFDKDALTTEQFDTLFADRISTYVSEKNFSWIISTPLANWNPTSYFLKEMLNLLSVAFFLAILLTMTIEWNTTKRLLLIACCALAGSLAIYGSQMNWWHVPFAFHGGLIFNLLVSWLLAAWCVIRFVLKQRVSASIARDPSA